MALKAGKTAVNMTEAPKPEPATIQDHSQPVDDGDGVPWDEGSEGNGTTAAAASTASARAVQAASDTHQAVAPATSGRSMTGGRGVGGLAVLQNDGFSDLDEEIGFGSFPIVKLDKNMFCSEGMEVDSFHCVLMQSRDKWIWKADDDNLFYSYDNVHDSAGRAVTQRIDEWVAAGFDRAKIENRKYKEVVAKMTDGPLVGKLVLLSIPPASVKRLGGYRGEVAMVHGRQLSQVVTKVLPGAKVQVNPKISFYPWNFEHARNLDENGE